MKWLVLIMFLVYVLIMVKVTTAWSAPLGGFGAFCAALVVVTSLLVAFGSLLAGVVVAIFMHVKEWMFRNGSTKQITLRKEKTDE